MGHILRMERFVNRFRHTFLLATSFLESTIKQNIKYVARPDDRNFWIAIKT